MIFDLGLIDYEECYKLQKDLVARRRSGQIDDSIILAEHSEVFTIGRTGNKENVLVAADELSAIGVKVIRVDRGGDVTYHGPGQLIIYPIIDLKKLGLDLHEYMRCLESIAIDFLDDYDVYGGRVAGKTGVWVKGAKIASIGIGAAGWVTFHGMSINLNCDLSRFKMINPCGMSGLEVTSLERIAGHRIDMIEAKRRMQKHFKDEITGHRVRIAQ
ncbi:MAG: lipoyl(octanoyl) transferase LipB [Candidatus Omnitrophica bacterium]|nr:lipoyl(octanoyl) transferase LipB [Candidatus Omnitrophota bacterium]